MRKKVIKSEKQFAEWFRRNYKKLGYSKTIRGDISRCPDFIMMKKGEKVGVELETVASNFVLHKHKLDSVDEIVCIVKDIKLDKPIIEIKELKFSGPRKVTLSIDEKVYDNFKKFCKENDIMLSKRVERLMKNNMVKKK